ncbi:hypothetical protein LCGC14_1358510, partial [marine sediment metagenome]|nr:hypothetical protein [Pricia sp.]
MLKACLFYLSFIFFLASCSSQQAIPIITISETNGLDRELEYISAVIPSIDSKKTSTILVAEGIEQNVSIPVQILDTIATADKKMIRILFPIRIKANQSQSYQIEFGQKNAEDQTRIFRFSKDSMSLETEAFKASFSTENDPRGGQVNGIILKDFNSQLLKRGHIAMHWAPNFSKANSEAYFNFEDIPLSSKNELSEGRYQIVKKRSGTTDSVPEINLRGSYTFYRGLPYFEFESTI